MYIYVRGTYALLSSGLAGIVVQSNEKHNIQHPTNGTANNDVSTRA